ncbi:hypothetical protein DL96DRAFT_1638563 [Flagelloscypha sp. PMI_526]|nr:hypothetical protein DL96DRAFT_1638563 [Flagelloscypha sp. PMI_526]
MTERIANPHKDANANILRAEKAEARVQSLENLLSERDRKITALTLNFKTKDGESKKVDFNAREAKLKEAEGHQRTMDEESMRRKIAWMAEEVALAEMRLKGTTETPKQVYVKANDLENHINRVKQEKESMESNYKTQKKQNQELQRQLDQAELNLNGIAKELHKSEIKAEHFERQAALKE